ncbi:hypothetical protein EJ02DRAFT_430956 [Clathrospora elynae]|uniref:BAH domain-containing protein n=1 Tax=Clathrospora elynae TaxID=706981 RepID=A0A6A5T367_9PLEO|nr:hypothetical protein EJ02DRAFT_430956 [Clathrospora elynae]
MARKSKTADGKPNPTDALSEKKSSMQTSEKKRKIDWATCEEFGGFEVKSVNVGTSRKAVASSKKQKAGTETKNNYTGRDAPMEADVVQPNPFPEADLSVVHMKIKPALEWESTNRYRKFTINDEEFEVGQTVFVKKNEEEQDNPEALQHWIAKVLEVRAGDASHVYLRVFWAYRPEDLPDGRQPYHGACELVVSNHMDIIEALTVNGVADVEFWDEDADVFTPPAAEQLFWRQSFDINKPKNKQLSKLKKHCIDREPCNPDKPLVQCPSCSGWLHAHCLEKRAVKEAYEHHKGTQSKAPKKKDRPSKGETNGDDSAAASTFNAELSTPDTGSTRLTVTDKRKGQKNHNWDVDVTCLLCAHVIEKVAKDEPDAPEPKTPVAQMGDDALVDEDEEIDKDSMTVDTPSGISTEPLKESDADAVIGSHNMEDEVEIKDQPISDAAVPEPELAAPAAATSPQARGCPLGANKKRKRTSTTPVANVAIVLTAQNSTFTNAMTNATEQSCENEKSTAKFQNQTTPAPAPVNQSFLQFSVRSVKRMLWR